MEKNTRIFLAGHRGMTGSAIHRLLQKEGYTNVLTRTHAELDLQNQAATNAFYEKEQPEVTILCAAKLGGMFANIADPLSFIRDNLFIQSNVFDAAHRNGCKQLLFLGSSCIYPRNAPMPLKEEFFLTGVPEPTNQSYAIAKIAGLELCLSHNAMLAKGHHGMQCRAIMPPNMYGMGEHFGEGSHALSGMMDRMHHAKLNRDVEFVVWGDGSAMREWMSVDDLATATLHALTMDWPTDGSAPLFYNTGTGEELSMKELALAIARTIGYEGKMVFDLTKPGGMPRKCMDSSKFLATGWKPTITLSEGLKKHYAYYLSLPEDSKLRAGSRVLGT